IANTNKTPEVEFIVEKKLVDAGNAGSITVEGKLIGEENQPMKTSWTVTVDKFESKPTKSGTINTIRIPANEMINPVKPILMRKIGNGAFEKVEVTGNWLKSGSYYEFKDIRNTVDDMTTEQVVYQYSFTATGVDTAEKYTTTATANIKYNDPTKVIPPVSASKTLDKSESEPMADLKGTGEGITDNISRTVHWIYEGQVDVNVPGDLYFIMKRPKNSGLKSPNDTVKPVVTIYEKGTKTERTDIDYEVIFDPALDAYKIKFDTNLLSPFDFKINYEMDIDDEQVVDEYKLDTKYIYQGIGMEKPKEYVPLTLTSARQLPLPGKTIEKISTCSDALHKVNLYGEMSGDGTEILWTARVANLDKNKETRPFTMDIKVGEGLGDAELMSVNSVGKSFPFVTKGNSTTDYVYDLKGDHNATKNFRVHADTTYHYIGNDGSNQVGTYHYMTAYRKPSFIAPMRNWKTDIRGMEYFIAWGSFGAYDDKANEADQSLKLGDYLEVSFKTPITDFSRMREKGSDGQYLGYEINVDTKAFNQKDRSKTNTATPVCHMENTNLTLREEPNQTSVQETMIIKSDIGQIIARGKYINNGNDIEWEMEVIPLRDGNSANQERDFKVNYQLVDSNNQPIPENTGLDNIRNRDPKKMEGAGSGGGFTLEETRQNYGGELVLKEVGLNERLIYTFTTPVLEDKEDYRLKVEGFYWDGGPILGDWKALADEGESNISYVIVDGKIMKIFVNKKWENVYTNAVKPDIVLRLMQISIDGTQVELTSKTVNTPNSKDFIETEFASYEVNGETKAIPRFDENGYRYQYILREDSLPGYSSNIVKMDGSGTLWNVVNTKDDIVAFTEDPVKYVNREDGTYPEPYQQDGPDIRNADTKELNSKGENYKIEYEDSIVGKSGQQTDIPGMFDMKLTMEGKGKSIGQGLDVVFVLDNSQSMRKDWNGHIIPGSYEEQTKLYDMRQKVNFLIDEIFKENEENNVHNSRVGVVNFGTTNYSGNPGGKAGYKHVPAGKTGRVDAYYNKLDMIGLTDNKKQIEDALPKAVHWGGSLSALENTGDTNLRNRHPGLTNIAGAVAQAGEFLFPDGEDSSGRKKVMIVLSDGAPTASVKLKNYPLDTNLSLKENLASTGIGDGYNRYTVANNRYYLQKQTYTTNNGVRIEDNGISAVAISEYYQKLHPDMEVYSLAMNKSGSGFEDPGTNSYGPTETPEVIMERVLRSLTTNHKENYFEAEDTEELASELDKIKNSLESRSIINGEVVDPMGDQVSLRVEKNFKPASNAQLTDGDYFLSDNFGNYLIGYDSAGNAIIGNKLGDPDHYITAKVQVFDRTENSSLQYPKPRNNRENQLIRIDQNGQPIKFMLDGEEFNNVNEDGTYKYLVAVHHDMSNPESPSTGKLYRHTREFTVIDNLNNVINYINGGYRLILIKNNNITLEGLNHVAKPLSTVGDGETLEDKVEIVRKDKNLLSGVKVTREGQGLKINGLNLGDDEEVTLQYRIHLKTEDPEFAANFYYQANKTTTLNPQPDKGDYYRYFPIPSVKGPGIPLELEKIWQNSSGEQLVNPPDIDILAKINR
ncbi:MAG: Cna B-type domain-containing protein, partial [Tissierellia bacterium]|nr:Cna B-type domain-containing protein [Tissierellia bacterium]